MRQLHALHQGLKKISKIKKFALGKAKASALDKLSKSKMDIKGKVPMDEKTKREMNLQLNEIYRTNRKLIK
tara:strand:+ start:1050 stop:1262 length:213 start_codon:yes stop_codon:yes gene_type:complete